MTAGDARTFPQVAARHADQERRTTSDTQDPWRLADWQAIPDGICGISGCTATETDPRGPVVMRDGSMHKVCPDHWEPIMRVLGQQASWESDAARWIP